MQIATSDYTALPSTQAPGTVNPAVEAGKSFWGKDGMSFKSVLDVVNPLQQLPIVSSIYRQLTGDTISPGSRLAGGALYGGPLGFISSLVNSMVETSTGKDIGGNVIAMLQGDNSSGTQLADNSYSNQSASMTPHQARAYNSYVQPNVSQSQSVLV